MMEDEPHEAVLEFTRELKSRILTSLNGLLVLRKPRVKRGILTYPDKDFLTSLDIPISSLKTSAKSTDIALWTTTEDSVLIRLVSNSLFQMMTDLLFPANNHFVLQCNLFFERRLLG